MDEDTGDIIRRGRKKKTGGDWIEERGGSRTEGKGFSVGVCVCMHACLNVFPREAQVRVDIQSQVLICHSTMASLNWQSHRGPVRCQRPAISATHPQLRPDYSATL